MQHKFKIGGRIFLVVGVSVNYEDFYIGKITGLLKCIEVINGLPVKVISPINGDFRDYKILFEWPNCTEEEAASVVEKEECEGHVFYKNYGYVKNFSQKTLISSLSSLASKMKSEGIIGSDKYLILEITTR